MSIHHRDPCLYRLWIFSCLLLAACDAAPQVEAPSNPFPKAALDELARSFPGRLGFFVKDLKDGVTYGYRADERFPPASSIKIAVLIELYRQAHAGRIDLSERRSMPGDISTHGSGVLARQGDTPGRSLREYARLMIVRSDNMATDLLIRAVGTDAVNSFLESQGCQSTCLAMEFGRWHYTVVGMSGESISRANDARIVKRMRAGRFDNDGLGYSDSPRNIVAGPRDMALLLEALHRGHLAGPEDTKEMLELMVASTHKRTIGRYVRPGIRVANKYGGSERIKADVGIVYLPRGPVVIAGFTLADEIRVDPGRDVLARMSRLALAGLAPGAVVEASPRRK